jgi:hypothetical protein
VGQGALSDIGNNYWNPVVFSGTTSGGLLSDGITSSSIRLTEIGLAGVYAGNNYGSSVTQGTSPALFTPEQAAAYWRMHIEAHPYFNLECECFAVLFLNTRRRVKGHQLITLGTMDTLLVHPREVFRAAVISSASCIILMHNHPSGESQPSETDIKVTRDLIRAGQLLKIEVMDHIDGTLRVQITAQFGIFLQLKKTTPTNFGRGFL